jgi:hypothetical protein
MFGPDDDDGFIGVVDDERDAARGLAVRGKLLALAVESEYDRHEYGGLALTGLAGYEGQLLVKCELSRCEFPKILECKFQHLFYF